VEDNAYFEEKKTLLVNMHYIQYTRTVKLARIEVNIITLKFQLTKLTYAFFHVMNHFKAYVTCTV
jgi:hypothetical protein